MTLSSSSPLLSDLSILLGLGAGNSLTGLSVAFTPANAVLLRWGILGLQGAILYATISDLSSTNNVLATFAGGSVCIVLYQYVEQALLNRWAFEAQGPTSAKGGLRAVKDSPSNRSQNQSQSRALPEDTFQNRLAFAANMTLQHRYPNTPWTVKGIPAFDSRDVKKTPTRRAFMQHTLLELCVLLLVLDANAFFPRDSNHETMFGTARIPLFRRWGEVTAEELVTRFIGVTMYAFFGYAVIDAQYHCMALLHVGTGLATPADYPPLVGRLRELYSLQQFWGIFWHQSFRRKLTSPAYFLTYHVLGLPRRYVASRAVFFFLTFFLSGVLHLLGDVASGCSWRDSGAMWFFCMQPVGLVLETAVVAAYRTLSGKHFKQPPVWARVLGTLYFLAWMTWTGPTYMWLTLRESKPGLLRFSVIGLFVDTMK